MDEKGAQSGDNSRNDGDVSSNDEEPNFSDSEGYVDDITDKGVHLFSPSKSSHL